MHAAMVMLALIGQVANGPDGVVIDYAQRMLPLKATHTAAQVASAPAMNGANAAPVWPTAPAIATPTPPVAPAVSRPSATVPRVPVATASAPTRPASARREAMPAPTPAAELPAATTTIPLRNAAPAAPVADAPMAPALREAVATPTEPEPIKPAQDEPPAALAVQGTDAASAAAPTEFVSKRSELGKPRTIVPDVIARPTISPEPQSSLGGWSKLLAGALFLASLGLIGYRHRQKTQAATQNTGAYAGSWLPPRAPGKSRSARAGGLSWQDSDDIFITGEPANALLVKEAKAAWRAASRPVAVEPADDVPFHDVVERRVQMHNAGKRESIVHTAPIRREGRAGARFKVGEQDYGRIIDLAEAGRTAHEIAEELGLPLRAVSSLVRGKTGSKPAEAAERHAGH